MAAGAGNWTWIQPVAQWAFLIIGICLVLGLLTRLASIAGIVLALVSYLPTVSFAAFNVAQFISDEVIVVICLLIIIFANAGAYSGCDNFIHIPQRRRKPRSLEIISRLRFPEDGCILRCVRRARGRRA